MVRGGVTKWIAAVAQMDIEMNKAPKVAQVSLAVSAAPAAGEEAWPGGDSELGLALRARLLERMHDARIPEGRRQAAHLASITGRAYQTTRRWIDLASPGLPDLASFKRICTGMDGDPSWLLGLVDEKRSLREVVADPRPAEAAGAGEGWVEDVAREVQHQMYGCRARRMRGDEMEPEIGDGDTMFIDVAVGEFCGNGNYLVTCDGVEIVRRLEYRVGIGLVLSCANARYAETIVKDAADGLRRRLTVLGRVEGVIQVRKFWRAVPSPGAD